MRRIVLVASVMVAACAPAYAQYATDFEPPLYAGAPAGVILTGQDGWYLPPVAGAVDQMCWTYVGNALGVVANPTGGLQFGGNVGPGLSQYPRGQHPLAFVEGEWTLAYDHAATYIGTPGAAVPHIASFSQQPSTTNQYMNALSAWLTLEVDYQVGLLGEDAAGVATPAPGWIAGPQWQNLVLNKWYRFCHCVKLETPGVARSRILKTCITDIATGVTVCVDVPVGSSAEFLTGSLAGWPLPTDVRMFTGGANAGNVGGWDNINIETGCKCGVPKACRGDFNCDGVRDFNDIDEFVLALSTGKCKCANFANCDPNGDGVIDFKDIDPFIPLIGLPCP